MPFLLFTHHFTLNMLIIMLSVVNYTRRFLVKKWFCSYTFNSVHVTVPTHDLVPNHRRQQALEEDHLEEDFQIRRLPFLVETTESYEQNTHVVQVQVHTGSF